MVPVPAFVFAKLSCSLCENIICWIACQDTFCIVVFKALEITYLRTIIKLLREGLFIIICSTYLGQKPRVSILGQRYSFFNPKNLWNQIRDIVSWFCCFWHLLVIYQYLQDTWGCKCTVVSSVVSNSLWPPWTISSLGSSVCGIFWTRILEWVAISFPGDPPHPGIKPTTPVSPTLDSFPLSHLGSPVNAVLFP